MKDYLPHYMRKTGKLEEEIIKSITQVVLELHLQWRFLERVCFERESLILKNELEQEFDLFNQLNIPKMDKLTSQALFVIWGAFPIHPLSWQHGGQKVAGPNNVQTNGPSLERRCRNACPSLVTGTSIQSVIQR